jgi:hypothetical protein
MLSDNKKAVIVFGRMISVKFCVIWNTKIRKEVRFFSQPCPRYVLPLRQKGHKVSHWN